MVIVSVVQELIKEMMNMVIVVCSIIHRNHPHEP